MDYLVLVGAVTTAYALRSGTVYSVTFYYRNSLHIHSGKVIITLHM